MSSEYIYTCKVCNKELVFKNRQIFANHVRWCKSQERNTLKFFIKCSCSICRIETTSQNINSHFLSHHQQKQPKSYCPQCNTQIFNTNKFCSRSCSASYTNKKKDYTKIKVGPLKGTKPQNYIPRTIPRTKVSQCTICNKWHSRKAKTCSNECKNKLLSIQTNKRIDSGWNPQEHRCRSKPSYLEKSFQHWLTINNFHDYIKNKTFRCGDKIYYGDFYFPKQNLLIELDGQQHKNTTEYDTLRDQNILQYYGITTIRISYTEFINKSKYKLVCSLLNINEQVTGIEPAEPIRL